MDSPSIVGLSGQLALRQQMDVTANNLANATTTGFRGDRTLFQSHVSRLAVPGREIAFVQDRATYLDTRQGSLAATGNPLDIAIDGEAFLGIERAGGGRAYSRDGRLRIDAQNRLVDPGGRAVLDEGGAPIAMPENIQRLEIRADGTLIATVNNLPEQVGRIGLFRGGDMRAIRKGGDGLLEIPQADAQPIPPNTSGIRIVQGSLEASTVQPVLELANMTTVQRAYENLQRIISEDDSRTRKMIEALSRPN
ncbi:flagellar basal-body rod protein FlgF [Pseudoroseomonas globiformis]|uniref:Flagellar basal-body rod protein FlgF n=1 Tax=Teichococcus globiformis TaxID=2307229 RepID=A0ABV7G0H6_9PROT